MFSDLVLAFVEKKQLGLNALKKVGIVASIVPVIIVLILFSFSNKYPIPLEYIRALQFIILSVLVLVVLYVFLRLNISNFLMVKDFNTTYDGVELKKRLQRFFSAEELEKLNSEDLQIAYVVERYCGRIFQYFAILVVALTCFGITLSLYTGPVISIVYGVYGCIFSLLACQKILPRLKKSLSNLTKKN